MPQQETDRDRSPDSKLLELEYGHATQNLFNVDVLRDRLFQFYILVTGAVITVSQIAGMLPFGIAMMGLLTFIFGVIVVLSLARLRVLSISSYQAQNLIRRYYIKHHPESYQNDLRNALLWDETNVPSKERWSSYSFLSLFLVTLLNSTVLFAAIYEILWSFTMIIAVSVVTSALIAIAAWIVQVRIYLGVLNREIVKSKQAEHFDEKVAALKQ